MKKYELLKDLPDLKAGNIIEYAGDRYACGEVEYWPSTIDNHPEWFREVKEDDGWLQYDDLLKMIKDNRANYIEKDKIREMLDKKPPQVCEYYEWLGELEELIK